MNLKYFKLTRNLSNRDELSGNADTDIRKTSSYSLLQVLWYFYKDGNAVLNVYPGLRSKKFCWNALRNRPL
jgi:hypothetical protein